MQRGKLRPIGHTGIEQRIGAGFRIGAGARHGFIQADQIHSAGARHNDQVWVFPRGKRRMDFAEPGIQAEQARFARAMCAGQVCVFNGEGRNAGGFQFLHRAHHIQRIAVAVIGIHHQWRRPGAADATCLFGKFRQRHQNKVRRAQYGDGGDGTREHRRFKTNIGCDSRRDRIMNRSRVHTGIPGKNGAKTRASRRGIHHSGIPFPLLGSVCNRAPGGATRAVRKGRARPMK